MAIVITNAPLPVVGIRDNVPFGVVDSTASSYGTFRIEVLIEYEDLMQGPGIWVEAMTLETPGVNNGSLTANLSAALDHVCLPELPYVIAPAKALQMARSIRLTVKTYGDGALLETNTNVTFRAIRGGVNRMLQPVGYLGTLNTGKFMTWAPSRKLATQYSYEFLYWLRITSDPVKMRCQPTYTDGTVGAIIDPAGTFGGVAWDVIIFPCGYSYFSLGSLPKPVRSWNVWVANSSNVVLSEVRTFEIDCYEDEPRGKYFMFENSLGGWDTAYFTGNQTLDMDTTGDVVERGLAPDDITAANLLALNSRHTRKFTVNSGYMPPGHALWLRDLVATENAVRANGLEPDRADFWYGQSTFKVPVPIIVDRGSIRIKEDEPGLDYVTFSYIDAIRERNI